MKYKELKEIVKEKIKKGEKLHGMMREIAIDIAIEEIEEGAKQVPFFIEGGRTNVRSARVRRTNVRRTFVRFFSSRDC